MLLIMNYCREISRVFSLLYCTDYNMWVLCLSLVDVVGDTCSTWCQYNPFIVLLRGWWVGARTVDRPDTLLLIHSLCLLALRRFIHSFILTGSTSSEIKNQLQWLYNISSSVFSSWLSIMLHSFRAHCKWPSLLIGMSMSVGDGIGRQNWWLRHHWRGFQETREISSVVLSSLHKYNN